MVSSALAEQLKKLAAPQSNVYTNDDRKTTSLLFNPKDAASKDRSVFYDIGVSGLRELVALYEGFRIYEDTLFCLSSKDFERAVQSKEINQNLDRTIEKFLLQLSPYLMLESSHKALEWLVNRYHIHQYNQDAIMSLILPYHETMVFIRFLDIMDIKSRSNKWNWLYHIQRTKIPLAKQVLYNQCVSNTATLQFIGRMVLKYLNEFGERADQLNTILDFYLSAALGTIKTCKHVTESVFNALLPTIIKALESSVLTFRLSGFMILGELIKRTEMKDSTMDEITAKIFTSEYDFPYDIITVLIPLLFNSQSHSKKMANNVLYNVSIDTFTVICEHLNKLAKQNCNILQFTLAFLSLVLLAIQSNGEEFRRFCQLPEIYLDIVDLNGQQPERVIKCVLDAFQTRKLTDVTNNDESDIEIIDDNDMPEMILTWYSLLLKNLENKYPYAFDKVIKDEFSLKSQVSKKRNKHLTRVLGFKPAVARRIGDSYLFENLNHINPELRIEAVKYISKEFNSLKIENADFVKESIIARFNDDDVTVVAAVLTISIDNLNEILSEKDLTEIFSTIISKKSRKWLPIIKGTIIKLCALDKLPVNQETILALVPLLFRRDEETAEIAMHILLSAWGQKFTLTKNINNALSNTLVNKPTVLREIVFKMLFDSEELSFDDLLDMNQLNKDNILDTCFFMLLKSCSFKKAAVEDMQAILELLLETTEKGNFISSTKTNTFSADMMPLFIRSSRKGKILFEVMEYILSKIIDDMNVEEITKPWCDLFNSPGNILISRLFDVCSRGLLNSSSTYNHNELLVKLFTKLFTNEKEVFEFVANCACGYILYASNARDCISTEQQLVSLDLLIKLIGAQENGDWMFESDVVILSVMFNLNNPCLAIRQRTFKFINFLLKENPDKNLIYVQLLEEFVNYKEEILLDHEQIMQVLNIILTKQTPRGKIFKRNCLLKFNQILLRDTPPHVTSKFLEILSEVNNARIFSHIVLTLNKLEATLKKNENNNKFYFNLYESKLFINICKRINAATVSTFTNENIWKCIEWGLKEYKECVLDEDFSLKSPCVLIMKQVNEEVFKVFPEAKSKDLVRLITEAGTFTNNPFIAATASSTIRKINLNLTDFRPILEGMVNVEDPTAHTPKKKKSSVPMLSCKLIETDEWKLGVTLLQCVQNKKKMIVDNTFVSLLFKILSKCLRFEEQSYVEYTKQLILSSLWNYCNQFVDDKNMEQLNSLKSLFDIDLVVQCIRGIQNQQTHNHALSLLSKAAYMLPEQVLHHTLEIFAFIGSSSLRHDDAYSFQIITKIIESIIPILVKLDKKKNIEDYEEEELQKLQNRVVPVLRTFADVVLHVPEHRRLPLYTRLLETLGPTKFLWVFLALLLEAHITHFQASKVKSTSKKLSRNLADQEAPMSRLDFAQNMLLEFSPEICLESFIKLMSYLKSLPLQKNEDISDKDVDPSEIFSINGHTQIQLRHYKYVIITFINSCLSCSRYIEHTNQAKDVQTMENHYKTFIINILTFIQSISIISDDKTAKYWRVMLHHSYDLLGHTNSLLSAPMFLSVIRGLLKHNLLTVRRKSMELLNSKLQSNLEMFNDVDEDLLHSLIPALLDIVNTIETQDDGIDIAGRQELEMNQQTALLSLKLLTRLLANDSPEVFKPVLETVTEYTCNPNISGSVMASLVLCLAELCSNLKAHALESLCKFMPALIKILKMQRKAETPELVLLSTVTAISNIIESLPLFLSPYLKKILYEYSILLAKWQNDDQESNIVTKLCSIKKKIASSIPPRVLIPVANETHNLLLEKGNFDAIGPVMSVLAESFANITTADSNSLQQDLTGLFLSALQLRSNAVQLDVDPNVIDKAEDEIVNALVSLVLKLSERSFRPFYFKIYDWAIRTNIEGHKDRAITFYRLSSAIASKLEGLFVLFAGHFIKNAAELLDSCNTSKTEQLYFDSEDKCVTLVNYIMKTLHIVFLRDSQNFLNKDRFETLLQPIVDQLENMLGGISGFKSRISESVIPCIAQFAVATADDSLWKLLNYQILLKTRHNTAEIRLAAVDCLVETASQLGSNWLPLLAETVPFLSELLEDGDSAIETATKTAIRRLEQILDEPLESYF